MQHRHEIEAVLRRHGIDFTLEISDRPEHAIEIVSRAIAGGCRNVLAVGGDGTMNECVNGIGFDAHEVTGMPPNKSDASS